MTDEPTGRPSGGSESERADLDAAFRNLQETFQRFRTSVETGAKDEWTRAKPEVQGALGDLQRLIDAAADRAKTVLTDVSKRIDPEDANRTQNQVQYQDRNEVN